MDTISVDDMAKFICNKPDFASKLVNRIIDILKLNISDIGSLDVPDVEKKDNTDQKVKTNINAEEKQMRPRPIKIPTIPLLDYDETKCRAKTKAGCQCSAKHKPGSRWCGRHKSRQPHGTVDGDSPTPCENSRSIVRDTSVTRIVKPTTPPRGDDKNPSNKTEKKTIVNTNITNPNNMSSKPSIISKYGLKERVKEYHSDADFVAEQLLISQNKFGISHINDNSDDEYESD